MPISRGNNCKFHLNKNEYDLVSDQVENCRNRYKKLLGADFLDDTIHLSKPIKNQTIIEIFNDFLVPQQWKIQCRFLSKSGDKKHRLIKENFKYR